MQVLPVAGAASVTVGQTSQFQAQGLYTKSGHASTTQDITSRASWQSSNPAVATISSAGLGTGVSAGTASITASIQGAFGNLTATSNITVTAAPVTTTASGRVLTALTITPGSQTITSTGQTAQLIAIGTYSAAPLTQDLSNAVTWKSSNVQVANVNSSGLVSGVGAGQTTITALATAADGSVIAGTGNVTVNTAPSGRILTSLSVIPPSQEVNAVGETAQYIAIGTYSAAPLTLDLTAQVAWRSSDVQTGQVNPSGLVTGVGSAVPSGSSATTITALATASDGSVISASAAFMEASAGSPVQLPTLTIYKVGNGSGTVTAGIGAAGVITGTVAITCGLGTACIGNFPSGSQVVVIAASTAGSVFDGWSVNCIPVTNKPNVCTLTTTNNDTVGAIFDPTNP